MAKISISKYARLYRAADVLYKSAVAPAPRQTSLPLFHEPVPVARAPLNVGPHEPMPAGARALSTERPAVKFNEYGEVQPANRAQTSNFEERPAPRGPKESPIELDTHGTPGGEKLVPTDRAPTAQQTAAEPMDRTQIRQGELEKITNTEVRDAVAQLVDKDGNVKNVNTLPEETKQKLASNLGEINNRAHAIGANLKSRKFWSDVTAKIGNFKNDFIGKMSIAKGNLQAMFGQGGGGLSNPAAVKGWAIMLGIGTLYYMFSGKAPTTSANNDDSKTIVATISKTPTQKSQLLNNIDQCLPLVENTKAAENLNAIKTKAQAMISSGVDLDQPATMKNFADGAKAFVATVIGSLQNLDDVSKQLKQQGKTKEAGALDSLYFELANMANDIESLKKSV